MELAGMSMPKLDHVEILVSRLEDSIRFYTENFGCMTQGIVSTDKPGLKLRSAMLPIGDNYMQLIEPHEGPWIDELKGNYDGTIWQICFEVEDIEEFYDQMKKKGITPVDILGRPLTQKYVISSYGNKMFLLPRDKTLGTRIEVVERVRK
jgi:catechol 2,3-dioxygenase-like lactoylglutathione lyase family enzyme